MSCQKMFYHITKNEEHTIKNKTNKTGKELETTIVWDVKILRTIFLDHKE